MLLGFGGRFTAMLMLAGLYETSRGLAQTCVLDFCAAHIHTSIYSFSYRIAVAASISSVSAVAK
jgi:hypothetical protein